jgi:hypothetical protein
MKNRNEDKGEIFTNQEFFKVFVVKILQMVEFKWGH